MNCQIYIKHEDGTGSYLTCRNRTEWRLKTAKKHLRDVVAGIVDGKFKGARYAALVMA